MLFQSIAEFLRPLVSTASWLSANFARLACALPPMGSYALAAAVVSSFTFAIACACWAVAERIRSVRSRQRTLAALRRSQVAVHFRDALVSSLPDGIVVLRKLGGPSLSYQGAGRLLQNCLDGPDGAKLAAVISALMDRRIPFAFDVRTVGIRDVTIRGQPVGDCAVLFLHEVDCKKIGRQGSRESPKISALEQQAIAA